MDVDAEHAAPGSVGVDERERVIRALRIVHSAIGVGELACLSYVWFCAAVRRRDHWLGLSIATLAGEGIALVVAKGCPFGILQRRAGDDVPMFQLWFGPRIARFCVPALTAAANARHRLVGESRAAQSRLFLPKAARLRDQLCQARLCAPNRPTDRRSFGAEVRGGDTHRPPVAPYRTESRSSPLWR
ncbi:hypothetical protein [Propionicicella superfundia]|uniref:hypothetical protein n=1 Tax=Propionicicella superfundia TaxID=348582 RepID=UPI0012EB972F|nr:hypothetical protein [Propionicicella superfundia]